MTSSTPALSQLWRTTTVRLTALFILIFVVFAVLLLALITWQSSIQIQRQQTNDINREIQQIEELDAARGFRRTIIAVERLSRQPGPGLYFLGDPTGQMIVGNLPFLPPEVITAPGPHTFDYERVQVPFEGEVSEPREGTAMVRSLMLDSGLFLVVGRDVVERRGFTAIIFQGFFFGVAGILIFSLIAGVVTAVRVLARIDTINGTATKIMSGNLSERIPITKRNDEFDGLATKLNAMLDRIEQLMVGLKEVTDNVAHDLKTPLTRMRNRAEAALRDGSDPETQQRALETTLSESDKLIRTFNALLMIARAEAGAPSGALADADISAIVSDVAELYAPVAEEEGMELETVVTDGIHLRANRELIGQALVNLVENAIKYTKGRADPARIVVGVRRSGDRVLIEVTDNGPGIPEGDRHRVVERFVRLDESRSEEGSGLGLSLVAAVARLHRGELRLEDNRPGLRAVIDLPAA
jgi:signal transduction histidine kinase